MRTDREKQGLNGLVRQVQLETAWLKEQAGEIVGQPSSRHTMSFDHGGWMTECFNHNMDGSKYHFVNEYSDAGVRLSARNYDPSGRLIGEVRYLYDQEARLIAEQLVAHDVTVTPLSTYTYDSEGRKTKIQTLHYPAEANVLISIEWTHTVCAGNADRVETHYDQRGEPVEVCFYNSTGLLKAVRILRDEWGNVVVEAEYPGEPLSRGRCSSASVEEPAKEPRAEFESESVWPFARGTPIRKRAHKYNEEGKLVESKLTTMGRILEHQTFKYDEAGNRSEEWSFDAEGQPQHKAIIKHEYDGYGNWIKELVSTLSFPNDEFGFSAPTRVTRRTVTYY